MPYFVRDPKGDPSKRFSLDGGRITVIGKDSDPILQGRDAFVGRYCEERGWDRHNLSIEQVLEIRDQPGWKDPTGEKSDETRS